MSNTHDYAQREAKRMAKEATETGRSTSKVWGGGQQQRHASVTHEDGEYTVRGSSWDTGPGLVEKTTLRQRVEALVAYVLG